MENVWEGRLVDQVESVGAVGLNEAIAYLMGKDITEDKRHRKPIVSFDTTIRQPCEDDSHCNYRYGSHRF